MAGIGFGNEDAHVCLAGDPGGGDDNAWDLSVLFHSYSNKEAKDFFFFSFSSELFLLAVRFM